MKFLPAALAGLALAFSAFLPTDSLAAKQCGGSGQRVCAWYEQIPACNPNLNIEHDKCVHPDCGRHDQKACTARQRLAQPCDWGFVPEPTQGICLTPKEITDPEALKRWAAKQYCRNLVSTLYSGRLPPEAQPMIEVLRGAANQAKANAASLRPKAVAIVRGNPENYRVLTTIADAVRKDATKVEKLKRLLTPDEFCAERSLQERVNQLKAIGLWPGEPPRVRAPVKQAPRPARASASGTPHDLWAIGLEDDYNLGVDLKLAIGFLFDFTAKRASPILALNFGVKTNAAYKRSVWSKYIRLHAAEVNNSMDLFVEVGADLEPAPCLALGGFLEAGFTTDLEFASMGGGLGGGAACLPLEVGGGAEWHWAPLLNFGE